MLNSMKKFYNLGPRYQCLRYRDLTGRKFVCSLSVVDVSLQL